MNEVKRELGKELISYKMQVMRKESDCIGVGGRILYRSMSTALIAIGYKHVATVAESHDLAWSLFKKDDYDNGTLKGVVEMEKSPTDPKTALGAEFRKYRLSAKGAKHV